MNAVDPNQIQGKRVLLLGLGVNQGGIGIARHLCEQGAEVRVTDLQSAARLAGALQQLEGLPIAYSLGEHRKADIDWAELVIRNPGVPRESPWLKRARANGARIEMEMTLFFRACPGTIVGVTGSKGKTSTSTMLASILQQHQPQTVLAGNMGRSALAELPNITRETLVVIELSSFQLEGLDEHQLGPSIAIITNVTPDHLDRYQSFEEYAQVKLTIADQLAADGWFIYRDGDAVIERLAGDLPARTASFGLQPLSARHAVWLDADRFTGRWGSSQIDLGPADALQLPGAHARLNLLAAMAGALAAGAPAATIRGAIPALQPVPDRLETVATIDGVVYVNDTTATVPEAAIAALDAYAGKRIILIAGGSDKQLDLSSLAAKLAGRAERVILLDGTATPRLLALLSERGYAAIDGPHASMSSAVNRAATMASAGDVIILSPGCASFGMFQNEFERGRAFRAAVKALEEAER